MKIERLFTKKAGGPYADITWEKRKSEIRNPDGRMVFKLDGVVVPSTWSQIAADILAQKYLRKAGVPQDKADGWKAFVPKAQQELASPSPNPGSEHDARQVFHRLAYTWKLWGESAGYFDGPEDASAFYDELLYMLARQMAAPNSPQWFNTGLHAAYGIEGPAQGHYFVEPSTGKVTKSESAYARPQPHACFILDIEDDLVNEGGIMDLVTREARLFKYGSGTGSNFSKIRGLNEPLSGGGVSSGLLSFLKIADRSAAAVKSGGTTRRAAKMVILDADHPDIETYVGWKAEEEYKVACLAAGSALIKGYARSLIAAVKSGGPDETSRFSFEANPALRKATREALRAGVPAAYVHQLLSRFRQGDESPALPAYDTAWEGEAYNTVAGQASNNSVRLDNAFMNAVIEDGDWDLVGRITKKPMKTLKARALWERIARAAWQCAGPGAPVPRHDQRVAYLPGRRRDQGPPIPAPSTCSSMTPPATSPRSTSSPSTTRRQAASTTRPTATRCGSGPSSSRSPWSWPSSPSQEIAKRSYDYRTLGLGYAQPGAALLMVMGLAYDSDRGRAVAAALLRHPHRRGLRPSPPAWPAAFGPFARYEPNKANMLRVIRNHRRAAIAAADSEYEGLVVVPKALDAADCPANLAAAAREAWDDALALGEKHGFRNAQVSAIAPTGTIGLLMDCDTTGVEPDYALVKFKKLAGGGYFKIINTSVPPALRTLGYPEAAISEIETYALGHGTLKGAPGLSYEALAAKGPPVPGPGQGRGNPSRPPFPSRPALPPMSWVLPPSRP